MRMFEDFVAEVCPAQEPDGHTWAFAFRERKMLVHFDGKYARIPTLDDLKDQGRMEPFDLLEVRSQHLGVVGAGDMVSSVEGQQVFRAVRSVELAASAEAPPGMVFKELRGLFPYLDEPYFWLAARAVQMMEWDRDHQFCGRCGTATQSQQKERCRKCPKCGLSHYPRVAPAVIVLVQRGDEMLLARSPHFPPGMYSTLAGFSEPGESLEQTVAREIEEEVGVQVKNVRYFGSQPWPFPHSLMIGFRADYAGGDLVLEEDEIEDAGWFKVDALPRIPPRLSIARALIDAFLEEQGSPLGR